MNTMLSRQGWLQPEPFQQWEYGMSHVQCAQGRPGCSIWCSTGWLAPWCQVGAAGGGQNCHGPRGPPDISPPNPLLPAKPLPLGSERNTAQTSEAAVSPSNTVGQFNNGDGHSHLQPRALGTACAFSCSGHLPKTACPSSSPALLARTQPGSPLGRQQDRGGHSHWQMRLLLGSRAININKLTRCFDETPLKLVHHEGPWEHSGR